MFKHLLVPLDGSRLAEAALPAAAYLAETLGATVTLLHVVERDAPPTVHGEHHLTGADEAQAYLVEVAARTLPPGTVVDHHVHTGQASDVARSVSEHAGQLARDLIVMCTHGRGGLRGLLFGSIAQQVVSQGGTTVLLIRPAEDRSPPPFKCERLLVPLDGDRAHERGMQVAAELARACGAGLRLVTVVPTLATLSGEQAATGRFLPGATLAVLELASQGAEEYLRRQVAALAAEGLDASAEVSRGDPPAAIARAAQEMGADVIALGTHGRLGMDAFWSSSTTPKVSGLSRLPLLLVPITAEQA